MKRILIGAAALAAAMGAAEAAVPRCYTLAERDAVHVRLLQSELLAAVYSCQARTEYDYKSRWAEFVRQHQVRLRANGTALRTTFQRRYPARAEGELNAFVTRVMNDASLRMGSAAEYCGTMESLMNDAVSLDKARLESFSGERFADKSPIALNACPVPVKKPTVRTARTPAPKSATKPVPAAKAKVAPKPAGDAKAKPERTAHAPSAPVARN